jgi:hypothetical protein
MESDSAVWELSRAVGVQGIAEVADALHFAQIDLFLGKYYRLRDSERWEGGYSKGLV